MVLPDQTALLCRAIRLRGRSEAEEILATARSEADRTVTGAREKTERDLARQIARRRRHAAREAARITDNAELRARQRFMAARQELLATLFAEGRERLLDLRHSREYATILHDLARRAVQALPGGTCRLRLRREDMPLFSDPVLEDLSARTGRELLLAEEPATISGGCLALSADGRMLVDFSFDTLLERGRSRLQEILAREIAGDNG